MTLAKITTKKSSPTLQRKSAMPRRIRQLSQNLLHELRLELRADHVGPRPEPDREPVLPRLCWWQTSRSRQRWHLRELDSRYVRLTTPSRHFSSEFCRRVFRLSCTPFPSSVGSGSVLSLSSERGSDKIHSQPWARWWQMR